MKLSQRPLRSLALVAVAAGFSLAAAPLDVREIHHRRAAGQHQRVDAVLRHQAPRLVGALAALVGGDRLRFAAA